MGILIVLAGGLLFLYLNIKCLFKINFTFYFIRLYFYVIIFRKKHEYERKININTIINTAFLINPPSTLSTLKLGVKLF